MHLSAIKRAHRERGLTPPHEHPLVHRVWKGIRRRRGTHQQGAAPLTADLLQRVIDGLPDHARGRRDKAILLVGFAGAFRRSELASLNLGDVGILGAGIRLRVVRRKTGDDEVYVDLRRQENPAYCPVEALYRWIDAMAAQGSTAWDDGLALFRSTDGNPPHVKTNGIRPATVRDIVMRAVRSVGLDPQPFSAHSLRSGFATSGAELGLSAMEIREAGGWKSVVTVDRYVKHRRQMGADAPRSRVLAAVGSS
jgi:integrase